MQLICKVNEVIIILLLHISNYENNFRELQGPISMNVSLILAGDLSNFTPLKSKPFFGKLFL